MNRAFGAVVSCSWLLASCAEQSLPVAERGAPPPPRAACAAGGWTAPTVRVLAQGLETPWGMTAGSDGRIFVTERAGRVRVIDANGLRAEPWATLPVAHIGESGLLGVMPATDYATSGALVVAGVFQRPGRSRNVLARAVRRAQRILGGDPGTDFTLRVYRLPGEGAVPREPRLVLDDVPASALHPGGAMLDRGAGTFLISVGDAMDPRRAQDAGDARGSILRVTIPTGDRPARIGAGAEIVALGVRNPQGLVALPGERGSLLFIDHGPTGMPVEGNRMGRDELNRFTEGGNYGWPIESGIHEAPRFERPLAEWTEAIAPAGLALLPVDASRADLFVTGLRGRTLRRLELVRGAEAWDVRCEQEVLGPAHGRLRAIAPHPQGGLLVATSNRDSRGAPAPDDDRVLWLTASEER